MSDGIRNTKNKKYIEYMKSEINNKLKQHNFSYIQTIVTLYVELKTCETCCIFNTRLMAAQDPGLTR